MCHQPKRLPDRVAVVSRGMAGDTPIHGMGDRLTTERGSVTVNPMKDEDLSWANTVARKRYEAGVQALLSCTWDTAELPVNVVMVLMDESERLLRIRRSKGAEPTWRYQGTEHWQPPLVADPWQKRGKYPEVVYHRDRLFSFIEEHASTFTKKRLKSAREAVVVFAEQGDPELLKRCLTTAISGMTLLQDNVATHGPEAWKRHLAKIQAAMEKIRWAVESPLAEGTMAWQTNAVAQNRVRAVALPDLVGMPWGTTPQALQSRRTTIEAFLTAPMAILETAAETVLTLLQDGLDFVQDVEWVLEHAPRGEQWARFGPTLDALQQRLPEWRAANHRLGEERALLERAVLERVLKQDSRPSMGRVLRD